MVGGVGSGDLVGSATTKVSGAFRPRVRVVRRLVGVGASVACVSAPDGSPGLGEPVNEVPSSSITVASSCPGILALPQVPAVEPAKNVSPSYPSAMAPGERDLASDEAPC